MNLLGVVVSRGLVGDGGWLVDVGGDGLDSGDVGDGGQGKGKDVVGNKGIH